MHFSGFLGEEIHPLFGKLTSLLVRLSSLPDMPLKAC